MAMYDDDVTLMIKPEIDEREYKQQMREIAKTSQTAAEQAFKQLDTTIKASMKRAGESIRSSKSLDDFVDKMMDINQQIRETGNLPDRMTTKLYQARQAVIDLDDEYKRLIGHVEEMERTGQKYVQTQAYTDLQKQLEEVNHKIIRAKDSQEALNQQLELLRKHKELLAQVGDTSKLSRFRTLSARKSDLQDTLQGTTNINAMTELEQQIKNVDRAMNMLGKDNLAIFRQIQDIEENLRFEPSKEGLRDVHKQLVDVQKELEGFHKQKDTLKTTIGGMTHDDKYELSNQYKRANEELDKMETELVVAVTKVNELEAGANKTAGSISAMRNAVWSISRVLGNLYTIGLDIVRMSKMVVNVYKRILGVVKQVVNWFKKLHQSVKGTADEHKKSWKQMLKDIFRYSLGIRSLFMLFRRLRGYIKEAFTAMAEQIPEVNTMLSELKSSLYALKGSLATAFEPILSAIAPALIRLIDLLAKAITYIGMFFAAFTGRGYVYKATKAIQNVAGAAKELNKQLQGFDELNNLTTNDGGGGNSPLAMFEKLDVPDWIKKIVDSIKKVLAAIWAPIKAAWDKMKDYVIGAWKRAAAIILSLMLDILRDFLKAWQKWGEPIFIRIFQIVGDIGMIVGNIALALKKAWNYNDNGLKIWNAILEIIYKIVDGIHNITQDMIKWSENLNLTPAMTAFREWLESCVPLAEALMGVLFDLWNKALKPILTWTFDGENSGVARFFKIFRDFNKKVDWDKFRDNISKLWEALGKFGQTVGEGLLKFIEELSDNLATFVNSKDFEKLLNRISSFFNSISYRDVKKYLDQIWRIIKNIAKSAGDVIAKVWKYKDKILDALEFASKHLETIFKLVAGFKITIDFARLAANIYLMVTAIAKASASMAEIGSISNAFALLNNPITIVLGSLALMIKAFVDLKKGSDEYYDSFYTNAESLAEITDNINQNMEDRAKVLSDYDTTETVVHNLVDELDQLQSKTSLSNEEQARMKQIVDELNSVLPNLNLEIDEQTGKLNMSTDAILRNVDALMAQARVEAAREDLVQIAKDQYDAEKNLYEQQQELNKMQEEYASLIKEEAELEGQLNEQGLTSLAPSKVTAMAKAINDVKADIADTEKSINDLNTEYEHTTEYIDKYVAKANESKTIQEQTTTKTQENKQALEEQSTALATATDSAKELQDILKDFDMDSNDWASMFDGASTAMTDTTDNMTETWNTSMDGMMQSATDTYFNAETWTTLTSNITNAFTTAFNSIILNTDTQMQTLYNTVETWINNIALLISALDKSISDLSTTVNDLNKLSVGSYARPTNVRIPHLATGAVIPPNKEFLAVLGDQKRGTNIESPLSTMVDAFNMANKGGSERELALLEEQNSLLRQLLQKEFGITNRQIFDSVRKSNNEFKKSNGTSAFA